MIKKHETTGDYGRIERRWYLVRVYGTASSVAGSYRDALMTGSGRVKASRYKSKEEGGAVLRYLEYYHTHYALAGNTDS